MRTHAPRRLLAAATLAGALLLGACGDFDVTNPNQPTLDDLINNPTRGKLSSAATGLFIGARADITGLIWEVGSLGREGVNLAGNNQPDYQEPYFGPLQPGGSVGLDFWDNEYRQIRSANIYLNAVPKAAQLSGPNALSAEEASASLGFGKTMKALAFMYVIATHGSMGAPVEVDQPVTAAPAPFVSEDSVYGYILGLLNGAKADLQAGGAAFPFPLPPGFSGFDTPAGFLQVNRALAAKAYLYRATASGSTCGTQCYADALAALGESFLSDDPADFAVGAYYDFSSNAGDTENELSDPLDGAVFFALPIISTLSQKQPGGEDDQRAIDKVTPATLSPPQSLAGIPIVGDFKFSIYLTNGEANTAHPIPLIRNEELILLRAEAKLGQADLPGTIADINIVRQNAGKLAPYGGPVTPDAVLTELLYNRRYSLLWEQGTTWVDARRFNRIVDGYIEGIGELPGFNTGDVPRSFVTPRFPIPDTECSARGLASGCNPLGT
jgi:hypothetical protein